MGVEGVEGDRNITGGIHKVDIRIIDRCTSGYRVREETNIENISIEAGKRALKFQDKIRRETENRILKKCRRENTETRMENDRLGKKDGGAPKTGRNQPIRKKGKGKDTIEEWAKYTETNINRAAR